jgi:ABC-type sugar transport system ATPase subunit
VVNDLPPKDRDIAMVFQNYALYPHMTVADNLAFGLKLRRTPKAEIKRRVGEAAAMLGLEPYLARKPAALSGGQRQRVAMGRAIVREPAAFLMDEPLSNLDAKLRVSMRAALNFVTAELVRDDSPAVTFAGFRLPVPAAVISGKPGLDEFFGKQVILGIRPSDFEDGAFADAAWPRIAVTAGVTEGLGTEIHAIFTTDAPPVEHSSITGTADGHQEDEEAVTALTDGKSLWTARVSARSSVRSGQPLELAVDKSRLH